MLFFGLSTRKIQVDHTFCTFGTAVLIFDLCTAVPIFGQCKHIISTASVAGTDVVCIIGTAVLIFGQYQHKISRALSPVILITLFCRDFEICRIYALFVLIFGARKCACAIFTLFACLQFSLLLKHLYLPLNLFRKAISLQFLWC